VDARVGRGAMIVAATPGLHLTYCTNIHAGESWAEIAANVETHVRAVKARVCPDAPFGVGLRLSARAARELAEPGTLAAFVDFLRESGLYVFTINGFPYGAFSGTVVKEHVYEPDWLTDERLGYSDLLARLLAALLPVSAPDLEGSVSTVPGCFGARGPLSEVGPEIAARLRRHAATLWRLRESSGRVVTLALEPEPACVIETTDDAATFFEQHLFSTASVAAFAALTGLAARDAEETLRRHLGVCLDACHAAVEFETPRQAVDRLARGGIRLLKVQVSAGLRVRRPDVAALGALERFAEGVYLHQVVERRGRELRRHVDLPEALAQARADAAGGAADEWRVHFHVPLFLEQLGPFHNTQDFLVPLLALLARERICQHLEVETYTWDVLPAEHRAEPVVDAIARELTWTLAGLRRA
jgi:sugar phosphate isomerase/epimerase